MSEQLYKFVFSIIFFIVSSIITYFLSTSMSPADSLSAPKSATNRLGIKLDTYEQHIMSAIVDPEAIDETLNSIGGQERIKSNIVSTVILPLQNFRVYSNKRFSRLTLPRGILLCGPPGTGKTLLARAVAKECGCHFMYLTLSMLENKYYGESSKLLNAAFSLASKISPCIMFFDEIDGMMRERSSEDQSCVYSFKTEFLSQLDGFNKQQKPVIVMACTNSSKFLDPALRRRLPTVYNMDLPDAKERLHILKIFLKDEHVDPSVLHDVAGQCEGFSGSDLNDLVQRVLTLRMQKVSSSSRFRNLVKALHNKPVITNQHVQKLDGMLNVISLEMWKTALAESKQAKETVSYVGENSLKENQLQKALQMFQTMSKSDAGAAAPVAAAPATAVPTPTFSTPTVPSTVLDVASTDDIGDNCEELPPP